MQQLGRFLVLISVPLVILILAIWPARPAPSQQERPTRIVFTTDRDGDYEIYLMERDGGNPVNLTRELANDGFPSWSRAANTITFVTARDGDVPALYRMDIDGGNLLPLSMDVLIDVEVPHWSPTGEWIAFSGAGADNAEVYVMDARGENMRNLTNHAAEDRFGAWSPDGEQLVFVSARGEAIVMYRVGLQEGVPERLTDPQWPSAAPAWSPDGGRIAFMSQREENVDVYVMDADGSNVARLTDHDAFDGFPAWSPDGAQIAFLSARDENLEIYVMDTDGSGQTNLTNSPAQEAFEGDFSWSPDGDQILFPTDRDGNIELYVMDADGSNQVNLTNSPGADFAAIWVP